MFLRNSYFYLFETTYLILTKISLQSFKKTIKKKTFLKYCMAFATTVDDTKKVLCTDWWQSC